MDGVLLSTPNLNRELWDNFPIRLAPRRCTPPTPRERSWSATSAMARPPRSASTRSAAARFVWSRVPQDSLPDEKLDSLFIVIVGTGLGGGAVLGGHAIQGSQGRAGHVGHILLPHYAFRYEHDRQLLKGNAYATAESAVSLSGLAHQLEYRLTLPEWASHSLNQIEGTVREKAARLRELVAAGDPLAQELFDDQARGPRHHPAVR